MKRLLLPFLLLISAFGFSQTVTSGNFFPVVTVIGGSSATPSVGLAHYIQVNNEVHVQGTFTLANITGIGILQANVSLPIPSTLPYPYGVDGICTVQMNSRTSSAAGYIIDVPAHAAQVIWTATATGNQIVHYSYMYTINQ